MAATSDETTAGAVAAPRRPLGLEVHEGLPGPGLQREWDDLAVATGAVPWVRPGWLVPWWQSMGRGAPVLLALRAAGGGLRAVLPLQRSRAGLSSPTNWHTPEYCTVAADPEAGRAVLGQALERSGTRLRLDFVDGALARELADVSAERGGGSHIRVLESSPYLPLAEGWQGHLDRGSLAETRRRGRRLAERGEVRLDVRDGTEDLSRLLLEGLAVEASGWKGRQGTAVASSPDTLEFYRAISRWAAEQGLLRLAFLRLDGRPLAFDLAVEHRGAHYLLKTGFDETERPLAPGKQLRLRMLEDCAARGLESYEFLGDAQHWKQEWTSLRRERMQVLAFPPGPAGAGGRVLHAHLLPAARRARDEMASRRRSAPA